MSYPESGGHPERGYGTGSGYGPERGLEGGYGGADPESRNWAMAAHASGPVLGLFSVGGLIFLGPLAVMLIKAQNPWVRAQAVEALNFAITTLIVMAVGWVLTFILIGFPIIIIAGLVYFILGIMAAVKASRGEGYRYPLTLRLVQ